MNEQASKPRIRAASRDEALRLVTSETLYACDGPDSCGRAFGNTPNAAYSAYLETLALSGKLPPVMVAA